MISIDKGLPEKLTLIGTKNISELINELLTNYYIQQIGEDQVVKAAQLELKKTTGYVAEYDTFSLTEYNHLKKDKYIRDLVVCAIRAKYDVWDNESGLMAYLKQKFEGVK